LEWSLSLLITKKAGYNKQSAKTGAVTLIQRFGSALNLNTRFSIPQGYKRGVNTANMRHHVSLFYEK
jgi:hypothetical protein